MKDIIIVNYRKRIRKSALNGQNIVMAINMWAILLYYITLEEL